LKRGRVGFADARRTATPGGELLAYAIQPGKLCAAIARLDATERVIGFRDPVGDRRPAGDDLARRGVVVTQLGTQKFADLDRG